MLTLTPPAAAADRAEPALRALHAQDVRLEAVGFRLASANAALCRGRGRDPGFSIHTLEQYGGAYRQAAGRLFALGDAPGVLAVAPGSPAEASGLREGDAILAADGAALPRARRPAPRDADFSRVAQAQEALARAFDDGAAELSVLRDGRPLRLKVRALPACPSLFQLVPDSRMNGAADGLYVQVSTEMAALAATDDELAALLAHELSHNILRHRARLDALHVDRGLLSLMGRNARLIRQTERDADRLSVSLIARAGYDPDAALSFWRRLKARSSPLEPDPTHPSWSDRLASIQAERDRIAADPNAPLSPDLAGQIAGP